MMTVCLAGAFAPRAMAFLEATDSSGVGGIPVFGENDCVIGRGARG